MSQQSCWHSSVAGAVAAMVALSAPVAFGQPGSGAQPSAGTNVFYLTRGPGDCGGPAGGKLPGGAGPMGAPGGIVMLNVKGPKEAPITGSPYSGVGTTETVQTLADGNRIVHSNTMRYYRDSHGRTRTEYLLSAVGPFTLDETRNLVVISDPVAGKRFVLHPPAKTAESLPWSESEPGAVAMTTFKLARRAAGAGEATTTFAAQPAGAAPLANGPVVCPPETKRAPVSVSLGQRTIQGLKATGTQLTYTIPAGEIGNELPIVMRSEQWISDDLSVVLASTQTDPTIGDTTYHLDQVARTEPDAALFTVPGDYKVEEPMFIKALKSAPGAPPAGGTASESK